jgi:hypothetical protein
MGDPSVGDHASCTPGGNRDPLREARVDLWTDIPNRAVLWDHFRDRSESESLTKAQRHGNLSRASSTNVGG